MKLYEIITEHEFPKAKSHHRKKLPDIYNYEHEDSYYDDEDDDDVYDPDTNPYKGNPHAKNPDIETLGVGSFATAYRHKKNPYDVTKGSRPMTEPDGFQAFFDAISKDKEAQSNPYFPRFRSMNKFHGNNKQSYVTKMEPLEKYDTLSGKEREMLVNKLFGEHGIDIINHYFEEDNRKAKRREPTKEYFPGEKLTWAVQSALENDTWADELRWQIEDKKFEQAIEFIQKIAKDTGYEFDMSQNNLMVRRTSVGPQLVFNDPLGLSLSARRDMDGEEIEGHPDWE